LEPTYTEMLRKQNRRVMKHKQTCKQGWYISTSMIQILEIKKQRTQKWSRIYWCV